MRRFSLLSYLLLLSILSGCDGSSDRDGAKGYFVISGLGVTMAPYDPDTRKAGDFVFNSARDKVFLEFGALVNAGAKELPTFEYLIDPEADVMAITDGEIVRMVYQEDTQDYEIGARSTTHVDFYVSYDHITSPTVGMGDILAAGQVLGKAGNWSTEYGRFEIMINNDATGMSYCPFIYFDSDLQSEYEQKVSRLMADWENFKSDSSIYDEASQVYPGCRYEEMETY